jgi:hypothetical protein
MNHSPNQPSSAAGGIVSARAQPLPLVLAVTLAWLALGGSATQAGCRGHILRRAQSVARGTTPKLDPGRCALFARGPRLWACSGVGARTGVTKEAAPGRRTRGGWPPRIPL